MRTTTFFLALYAYGVAAIWPIPSSYSSGDAVLWIDAGVRITYNGANNYSGNGVPYADNTTTSHRIVTAAIERTYDTIFSKNFIPWKFHPRNSDFEPHAGSSKTCISSVVLQQNAADPSDVLKPAAGTVDESYTLTVSVSGEVMISAVTSIGLVRGLTTFTQLFFKHSDGSVYTTLAPVAIQDAPKFQHRGLNMDVSRAYYPPAAIYRTIDALAYNKFNRLHLHATDSQSWTLEIPSLPLLAEKGAYEKGLSYSPAVLQQIQEYGALQGVEVYIEIDMPGHTSSIWFAYPDLIAAFNVQPNWDSYAAEPPSGTLKLNSTAVYDFLNTLFDDLLPRVSQYSSYFHTGGDEVNINAYKLDNTVGTNDTAVLQPLIQKLVDRNHAQVRANGLIPVVLRRSRAVMVERRVCVGDSTEGPQGAGGKLQLLGKFHTYSNKKYTNLILTAADQYLDCGHGQWLNFNPGTSSETFYPYADYCSPRKNWRLMYAYDPLHGVPSDLAHLVLGGECSIWSEQTDPVNLDRNVWPRACAAAEVLWSGAKDAQGQNRSQVTAAPRLSEMRERLVARGVMAEPIQMPFCTQNGSQCSL
ncbi:Glucosamine-6-phosphate isomerase (Glucosamine-6-phosphate deaminase) (GNPDA) (GlcN6P deaminase) [Elasticomyces elasticus]|nr:Glucosamine-6-phosphate isomerase (Glucosamine-6-phosphate deaminase) (GNPDA) (GlcN6P deaminase) [Elasticomyces elasticus]KAK4994211.1 Glucosamine-6-phosphate isomerase (Glucosamine-6-phosphate deaminase) (GNPDA) (GlcN6P deaminase) [Elasticomyces elasticus]